MARNGVDDRNYRRDLNRLIEQQLPQAIKNGLEKACLLVETEAKENTCPKDQGQLKDSIKGYVEESGRNEYTGYVEAGDTAEHALYVHEGTSKMPARPFLKDALDNKKDEVIKLIKKSIKGGR